jgi:hypothetical protein
MTIRAVSLLSPGERLGIVFANRKSGIGEGKDGEAEKLHFWVDQFLAEAHHYKNLAFLRSRKRGKQSPALSIGS